MKLLNMVMLGMLSALVSAAAILPATKAAAQSDPRMQLRTDFDTIVKGKKVAWVPITLGNPLGDSWTKAMKGNFDRFGIEFVTRDPNFDSSAQLQAVTSMINEKPDVLIVQNPNVALLANELKRAMDVGIYVLQVNMRSNQPSDAYVGVDYYDTGRLIAEDIGASCGGGKSSGKVAIVQGEPTAAGSVDQLRGAMDVFKKNPSIKIVSNSGSELGHQQGVRDHRDCSPAASQTSALPMVSGVSCRPAQLRR